MNDDSVEALNSIKVERADDVAWDESTDVVVVGAGAAGLCTALEARARGAEVMALDRFWGGGATAISGGVVYAGGGTHIQDEAGVEDTVDEMYKYLSMEVLGVVGDDTLRDFCEQSAADLRWLTDHGVPFEGSLCPVKTSYPSKDYFLYLSGNESFPPYCENAKPAARGHRVVGGAFPGANFTAPLQAAADEAGVDTRFQTRVGRLVVDSSGAVVGVEAKFIKKGFAAWSHRHMHYVESKTDNYITPLSSALRTRCEAIEKKHSQTVLIRCRRGVVLSAGGFIYNRAMLEQHAPHYLPGLPLGTSADDGTGIKLGQSARGATDQMSRVSAWRFLYPPDAFANGILVDRNGERFCNEFWYGSKIGEAMCEHGNEGVATLILDAELKDLARRQAKYGELQWFQKLVAYANLYANCTKSKDVEALAETIGVPAAVLRKTLSDHNEAASGAKPDPFGKDQKHMQRLEEGPFYSFDASLGSKRFVCATLTLGGLVVNEKTGQVRDVDGKGIPGLYAAGRNAVGICSRQYVSGLSIADCVYSGRRAGRSAATL